MPTFPSDEAARIATSPKGGAKRCVGRARAVTIASTVRAAAITFAKRISMGLGTGLPLICETTMLVGLRSKSTTPYWYACCRDGQIGTRSTRRPQEDSRASSQKIVCGGPPTSFITKTAAS